VSSFLFKCAGDDELEFEIGIGFYLLADGLSFGPIRPIIYYYTDLSHTTILAILCLPVNPNSAPTLTLNQGYDTLNPWN